MKQETIDWIFSDIGSHIILTLISIFIGIIILIIWFFSKSKKYDSYKDIGAAFIFGSPLIGPLLMVAVYLFICITPIYLVGRGLIKLKKMYHRNQFN